MSDVSPLQKAFDLVGLIPLSKGLNLTYQALKRWERQGRLPRTEWTGETTYAQQIEKITDGAVPASDLLAWGKRRASEDFPAPEPEQKAIVVHGLDIQSSGAEIREYVFDSDGVRS